MAYRSFADDLPAAGRMLESAFRSDRMFALLAGALGLVAVFIGIFSIHPRVAALRNVTFANDGGARPRTKRSGGHVETSAIPLLQLAGSTSTASRSRGHVSRRSRVFPGRAAPKRSDPGHDLEASLQKLLSDWKRAAA